VAGKEPRQAYAIKLGGNFLITAMIHSLGEAFVFADRQGMDPETFFDAVNNALFQSPACAAYAGIMLHSGEPGAASIEPCAKDLRLLREAAANRQTRLSLADQIAEILAEMRRTGAAGEDLAIGLCRMAQQRSMEK
jgi:3-hydroxyisobutyrate dehydrogenase-like beta-hydroxyacid dehydrogenase